MLIFRDGINCEASLQDFLLVWLLSSAEALAWHPVPNPMIHTKQNNIIVTSIINDATMKCLSQELSVIRIQLA